MTLPGLGTNEAAHIFLRAAVTERDLERIVLDGEHNLSSRAFGVVLHPGSKHPDAGRVGQIVSRKGTEMLVEFWRDDLIGKSEFSTIPLGHWGPVPELFVEEYEPRAKKRGWRVNERGMKMFRDLGWAYTAATEGRDYA